MIPLMPLPLLVATSNPHKLEELAPILEEVGIALQSLADVGIDVPEPDEDQPTFAGNAKLKAGYYASATARVCLADDSGLVVDALDGEPGVRSARYAGVGDSRAERDAANNAKLLDALSGVPDEDRAARFVCAMSCCSPAGTVLAEAEGVFPGRIGRAPVGDNGFGYDPLLVLPDGRTAAQLAPAEKNARSHRGHAARAIAPQLIEAIRATVSPPQ